MTHYWIRPLKDKDRDAIILMDQIENPYPWPRQIMIDTLSQQSVDPTDIPLTESEVLSSKQKRHHWLIEDSEARLCGYLLTSQLFDEAELELIVVAQHVRRQGLAKKLITTWLASVQGVELAMLEVRESNLGAITLYEALGFLKVGLRKHYYTCKGGMKESAVLMNLSIK